MSVDFALQLLAVTVNVVGFLILIRQVRQQALATRGEAIAARYALSYEILRSMASQPQLYAYFNDRKRLEADSAHRIEALCCCEMIANYCDNTALQRESIPVHVWKKWRLFIAQQLRVSVVLCEFIEEHRDWYSPELLAILDEMPSDLRTSS